MRSDFSSDCDIPENSPGAFPLGSALFPKLYFGSTHSSSSISGDRFLLRFFLSLHNKDVPRRLLNRLLLVVRCVPFAFHPLERLALFQLARLNVFYAKENEKKERILRKEL
ncbi:hypothetical protein CEXT_602381 [Caerostris extrusa]|uniref:Maturase K n=1 Tax=Caerostris extrusa TaxID=172846 RepID=A0AAV4XJ48_CAEEX|nr:hypothetical protein CEXT_602381 [Caerostris extrusa]